MLLVYFKVGHYWMVILPMAYYFYQSFALFIAGTLSGELKKLKDLFLLLNFTTHSIGIVMIPILFIWILNPELSTYLPKTLTVVDRKSTRLNSSHVRISYAVFCL